MKHDEFQRLVDRDLSGLVWDERQRQRVLHAMNEEERPIVKKKAYTALILTAVLIFGTLTALAATVGLSTIGHLLGLSSDAYEYHVIAEEEIVYPASQHCDSEWLSCEAGEMYWAEDGLYVMLTFSAKDPGQIALSSSYFNAGGTIPYQGKDMSWWEFRHQEGLTMLRYEMTSYRREAAGSFAGQKVSLYQNEHDGTNSTVVYHFPEVNEADAALLSSGGTLTLPLEIEKYDGINLSTLDTEHAQITIEFPPMNMQEGPRKR